MAAAVTAIEWAGAVIGLIGAFLLAANTRVSRWGWIAFLASNVLLIVVAALIARWGLLAMQVGYLATSVLGIFRTFAVARPGANPADTAATRR